MPKNRIRLRAQTRKNRTKFTATLTTDAHWQQEGAVILLLPSGVSEPMQGRNRYSLTITDAPQGKYKAIANLVYHGPTAESPTAEVRVRPLRKKRKSAKKK